MSDKYDKNSLVFQLAKRSRTMGVLGKFITHEASIQNLKTLTELFNFVQSSLKYFLDTELLSPTFHQIASNALTKLNNELYETRAVMEYLDEWVEKASGYKQSEADEYFCKVYSYDIYMNDLNSDIVCQKLKELGNK
ncbi:hypothetical protein QR692_10290 [Lactococcus petauri]|uniref:hypothetical protein n=1 Tax=Lactococcus petauri TaxID=1940789 RepID=UPI002078F5A1|nr:hypothetical protein [Lactococcus petauri]USI65372.1 hypothetical protein LMK05_11175 [Lactococcus petauri]USI67867.1 hypothetical protein LMK04_10410 [Lactococcus petauri]WJE12528.1 hypothetical protein QR692_10290 [Lactococcus petauri]